MIQNFVNYDTTGRIIQVGSCLDAFVDSQAWEGVGVMRGEADPTLHWVQDGEIVLRPEMPVSITGCRVEVPPKTSFTVTGKVYLQGEGDESGILDFQFDEPGEYEVRLENFPYQDKTVVLRAD